jgi:hypothetical protein
VSGGPARALDICHRHRDIQGYGPLPRTSLELLQRSLSRPLPPALSLSVHGAGEELEASLELLQRSLSRPLSPALSLSVHGAGEEVEASLEQLQRSLSRPLPSPALSRSVHGAGEELEASLEQLQRSLSWPLSPALYTVQERTPSGTPCGPEREQEWWSSMEGTASMTTHGEGARMTVL